MQANKEIRTTAIKSNVRFWQIADEMGIHEVTLIKRLRHELPESEKAKILSIIEKLYKENKLSDEEL
ncbi:hypothetical protein [Clostridium sp. DJ247]|uniref:hypothetical protein n=1 Tax=Clostridium sp. DJ247 TaxID=2726188 RepID=UPI001623E2C7|nr:hypothetical protein [Clostridium sp. DJ247]MBC2581780.1 hypothetical protein [Clostridium sp. DJ247]